MKRSILLIFFGCCLGFQSGYGQVINAPNFNMVSIDGDTSDLSKINDTLVFLSFQRTYSVYSRLQISIFRDWQAMITRPVQFWIISTESIPMIRWWRDSCLLDEDNFNYFGGEKSLSSSVQVLPTLRICYNQKQYLKHEGYVTLIGLDSLYMVFDSILNVPLPSSYNRSADHSSKQVCRVYPNPSAHSFRILIPDEIVVQKLELYSILGQRIREYAITTSDQEFFWSDQDGTGGFFIRIFTQTDVFNVPIIHLKEP